MRWHKAMQHGYLINMENKACVWENLAFARMQKDTRELILFGGKLLSRAMNMLLYWLGMHITTVGYVLRVQDSIKSQMFQNHVFEIFIFLHFHFHSGNWRRLWSCCGSIHACQIPTKCTSYVQPWLHAWTWSRPSIWSPLSQAVLWPSSGTWSSCQAACQAGLSKPVVKEESCWQFSGGFIELLFLLLFLQVYISS